MENHILTFVLISLLILILIVSGILLIVYYSKKMSKKNKKTKVTSDTLNSINNVDSNELKIKNNELNTLIDTNKQLKQKLEETIAKYESIKKETDSIYEKQLLRLSEISNLSLNEARKELLSILDLQLKKEKAMVIDDFNKMIKKEIEEKTNQLILNCIESMNEDFIINKTSFTIKLDDDSIKGRIIGKDGRNKKTFEMITGVDIIIEKEPEITISCFNPMRREIAKNVLIKLIQNKNIEPSRIEKYYEQEVSLFNDNAIQIATDVIENKLHMFDINKGLYSYVGKLFFRTSYSQNILAHSQECAMLAVAFAREMGLDQEKAKRAAFFHDIGKSIDFEIDNDHVESGLNIAKQFGLDEYIINAIESHHDKVPCNNIYSAIVKVVDKLSASRPGARTISYEEYIKRITTIESICNSFEGVKTSYAVRAGKNVRIIVDSKIVDDITATNLAHNIKLKLENNPDVNKQPIEIILIRENRIELKTNGSAHREKNLIIT